MTATITARSNRFILEKQQLCTCVILFLYISLPSLHGYDKKVPIVTFCGVSEPKTTTFFSFLGLRYCHSELISRQFGSISRTERGGIIVYKQESLKQGEFALSDAFVAVTFVFA